MFLCANKKITKTTKYLKIRIKFIISFIHTSNLKVFFKYHQNLSEKLFCLKFLKVNGVLMFIQIIACLPKTFQKFWNLLKLEFLCSFFYLKLFLSKI